MGAKQTQVAIYKTLPTHSNTPFTWLLYTVPTQSECYSRAHKYLRRRRTIIISGVM